MAQKEYWIFNFIQRHEIGVETSARRRVIAKALSTISRQLKDTQFNRHCAVSQNRDRLGLLPGMPLILNISGVNNLNLTMCTRRIMKDLGDDLQILENFISARS